MRNERSLLRAWWCGLALVWIVLLGLGTIVGSGGGVEGCFFGPCPGDFPPEPVTPTVDPPKLTVQVGTAAVFSVSAPGIANPTYQWSRAPRGGSPVAIAGATGATYTLSAAQLADDGATFSAAVQGSFEGGPVTLGSSPGRLAVSSMPGVVFQDSEFLPADWSVAAISEPSSNGPTHSEEQATTGGNPGAYRKTTIAMATGPSKLTLFEEFQPATYDPATQGAVYVIEIKQDCLALPGSLGVGPMLLIEQDGRRYIAGAPTICGASIWSNTTLSPASFGAADFLRVDGPACAAGQSCPDFAATGAPIRFGFTNSNEMLAGIAGAAGGFGVDNWKVTVWRR